MKKLILSACLIFICSNIFAQDVNHCQFIGIYDIDKKGVCSNRAMKNEGVADNAAYYVKRTAFNNDNQKEHPQTYFVDANEAIIVYEYEKRIAGWGCNAKVISTKKGKTLEDCDKQLANHLAKAPNDFATPPNTIFTWQGKGLAAIENKKKTEYTKDYGGLSGKFISANTGSKDIIVAQLHNRTKDQLATVLLRTSDGKMSVVYIAPGRIFTKKYDTKELEMQVLYQHHTEPKPEFKIIEFIKNKIKESVINENGTLKPGKGAAIGVRG